MSFLYFLIFLFFFFLFFFFFYFFFFSSRRRHTRFDCDWSSDVCSSDLGESQLLLRTICNKELGVLVADLALDGMMQIRPGTAGDDFKSREIGRASCRERV